MADYLVLHIDLEFIAGAICNANGGVPVSNEKEELLWLYFFNNPSQNKISFGKENKKNFLKNVDNYYGNFFDKIMDEESKYITNGLSWPVIELLEDSGILKLLSEKYKERTLQASINIPTLLTFSSSIKESAKIRMTEYLSSKHFKIESSVIKLPELISYYYWKKNRIVAKRDKVIICLKATNSTLHISKLIFIDGFYIIDPGSTISLKGKGYDPRKKAIIRFVIDCVNEDTKLLKTEEQIENECERFESDADEWISELDNTPENVPVIIQEVSLSPALTIKKDVCIRKETIEKNTGNFVNEIINIYNSFKTNRIKDSETIAAVILTGECFRNNLVKDKFKEILNEKLIISPLSKLSEIISVYPKLDFDVLDDPDKRKILIDKAIEQDDEEKELIRRKNEADGLFSKSKVLITESKLIEAVAALRNAKELDPDNAAISKFSLETEKFCELFSKVQDLKTSGELEDGLRKLKRLEKLFGSVDFMVPIDKLRAELEDLLEKRNSDQIEEEVQAHIKTARRLIELKKYPETLVELKKASELNNQNQEIKNLKTEVDSFMILQSRIFKVVKDEADEFFAGEDYVEAEKKYKEALSIMDDVECRKRLYVIPKLLEDKHYFETTIQNADSLFADKLFYKALDYYKEAEKIAKLSKKEELQAKILDCEIKIASIENEVKKLIKDAKESQRRGNKEAALKSYREAQKLKHDESIASTILTLQAEIEKDLRSRTVKAGQKPVPKKFWASILDTLKNGNILQKVIIAGSIFIILFVSAVAISFFSRSGSDSPPLPLPAGTIKGEATVNQRQADTVNPRTGSDEIKDNTNALPLPSQPEAITGPLSVTQGQSSVTYSVPSIANAKNYLWSLPAGATGSSNTNNITVNFSATAISGKISVKGHNTSGDGPSNYLAITVNTKRVITNGRLEFSDGYYEGAVENGKMSGDGKYTFTKTGIISVNDPLERRAETGEYIVGKWRDGNLLNGILFDKNGNQKDIITL